MRAALVSFCLAASANAADVHEAAYAASDAVGKKATKDAPSRVGKWVTVNDDVAAICTDGLGRHSSGCFDGTVDDDDYDDQTLDWDDLHGAAQPCATCGYGTEPDDYDMWHACLSCGDGATLLIVHDAGCRGLCVLDAEAPYLIERFGFAALADSTCEAAVPCYDDDATPELAADGFVPSFIDDDDYFESYSYSFVDAPDGARAASHHRRPSPIPPPRRLRRQPGRLAHEGGVDRGRRRGFVRRLQPRRVLGRRGDARVLFRDGGHGRQARAEADDADALAVRARRRARDVARPVLLVQQGPRDALVDASEETRRRRLVQGLRREPLDGALEARDALGHVLGEVGQPLDRRPRGAAPI